MLRGAEQVANQRVYACIDLKSFYASVECRARGLDPLTTNLVVADASRTEKTICLAVTPSLKAYGIPGRARLFEVVEKVRAVNAERKLRAPGHQLTGESSSDTELKQNSALAVAYIVAPPQMAQYMKISTQIYQIYLKYIAPEDIHTYSIDEVMLDLTAYLATYNTTAHALVMRMIKDVLRATGITATAGIATNLYLAKVAMDIVAKHIPPDRDGARIAELDELRYRQQLWSHRPLTDFWRVGRGYAKKLEDHNLYTMGDIARCSLGTKTDYYNEELLYKLFGINAELLIDHAWGWEPATIADIKAYKPESHSLGAGQVLHCAYDFDKGRLVVREMAEQLVLDLVAKRLVTDQMVLHAGYDIENLTDPARRGNYHGPVKTDLYGRKIPKSAHGSINLKRPTSSSRLIVQAVMELYDRIVDPALTLRRFNLVANHVVAENSVPTAPPVEQLDMFTDYAAAQKKQEAEAAALAKEKKMQQAMLSIKERFGKNAILKGTNLEEGATTIDRNKQIGGHKA